MAIGIDTSKWKPRQVTGTPSARARNILGIGVLGLGVVCGLIFHTASVTKNLRKATENLYEDPIEEIERKQMIAGGFPNRPADKIRRLMEEAERPDLPYK